LQIAIIKTAKLMQFGKLLKLPSIGFFCNYENGQSIAFLPQKNPLYREFLHIYKNGQIIAILQIAIYKNGKIIAICKLQFIKMGKLMQFSKLLKLPSIGIFANS
jgi:hypothetical protein